MSAKPARVSAYLGHIHEAIERIEAYTQELTQDQFTENRLVQDAVIRNLEIIGEESQLIFTLAPLLRL